MRRHEKGWKKDIVLRDKNEQVKYRESYAKGTENEWDEYKKENGRKEALNLFYEWWKTVLMYEYLCGMFMNMKP
jgi:hypothetical protein